MELVLVAVVVGVFGLLTERSVRAHRREDWAREDAREARAEVRDELAQRKLDAIHTVANSNLTEAIRARLAAMSAQLVTLRSIADPSPEQRAGMEALQRDVDELTLSLKHRDEQTDVAAQITANTIAK